MSSTAQQDLDNASTLFSFIIDKSKTSKHELSLSMSRSQRRCERNPTGSAPSTFRALTTLNKWRSGQHPNADAASLDLILAFVEMAEGKKADGSGGAASVWNRMDNKKKQVFYDILTLANGDNTANPDFAVLGENWCREVAYKSHDSYDYGSE